MNAGASSREQAIRAAFESFLSDTKAYEGVYELDFDYCAAAIERAVQDWERDHGVWNGVAMMPLSEGEPVQFYMRDGIGMVQRGVPGPGFGGGQQ